MGPWSGYCRDSREDATTAELAAAQPIVGFEQLLRRQTTRVLSSIHEKVDINRQDKETNGRRRGQGDGTKVIRAGGTSKVARSVGVGKGMASYYKSRSWITAG